MAIFVGLVTAICFGSADFFGGISAKRTSVLYVVGFSHLVGLVGVLLIAPFLADAFTLRDFGLGAVGGACGGIGVALLYRCLAIGPMAVVAPLTAITSAAVPALFGVLSGETLSVLSWIGVGVALLAIGLSSKPNSAEDQTVSISIVLQSLAAGTMFGTMFIFLDVTEEATSPWPVVGARVLTTTLLLTFIFAKRRPHLPTLRPALGTIALAGLFDTGSNILFLVATNLGDLTIVAVVSSLYPAATVVLARLVLSERMSRFQAAGLVAAILASSLIALG